MGKKDNFLLGLSTIWGETSQILLWFEGGEIAKEKKEGQEKEGLLRANRGGEDA